MPLKSSRQMALIAVAFAEQEAAAGAREVGGNNTGPWVRKYLNARNPEKATHDKEPWCCAFYCWCWLEAAQTFGTKLAIPYTRSCGVLLGGMKERGWLQVRAQVISANAQRALEPHLFRVRPGDAAFWDFNGDGKADHVNMVHHMDPDGILYTLGGNEGAESSGAPVKLKQRGRIQELTDLLAVGWMVPELDAEPG